MNEKTLSQEIREQSDSNRKRYRYWFVTYNNPPDDWRTSFEGLEDLAYWTGQLEEGKNGTPHVQALLYFSLEVSGNHFKQLPCWHKGIFKKDVPRVTAYVTKLETRKDGPHEYGESPSLPRSRCDFKLAQSLAKEGRFQEIDPEVYVKFYGNLKKIHAESGAVRDGSEVRGVWIFGRPGDGKSHLAREIYGASLFLKSQSKWWDGFSQERHVLLDDLDTGGACLSHHLKIWADKWGNKGEIKGGFTMLTYETFIVTSNYMPRDLWPNAEELIEAISRRFILIVFIKRRIPICPIRSDNYFLNSKLI